MKNQFKIRHYNPSDKEAVLNLLKLNTPKYFSATEEADFLYYLQNEIEYYFVIQIDTKIVGCGGFNFSDDPGTGRISWDILHPEFQRQSLGAALLNFRIEKLKTFTGLKRITVRTSQIVYKFYEKHGFRITDIVEDYWAKGFHLYQMEYQKWK